MTNADEEPQEGISDEQLPEDLQPTDDNPLAKPLTEEDDPKSPEELDVLGGSRPEQSEGDAEGDTEDSGSSEASDSTGAGGRDDEESSGSSS